MHRGCLTQVRGLFQQCFLVLHADGWFARRPASFASRCHYCVCVADPPICIFRAGTALVPAGPSPPPLFFPPSHRETGRRPSTLIYAAGV